MPPVPRVELSPGYTIPRIVNGAWQLSEGHARASLERDEIFKRFDELVAGGFTAFDCADIYTGVEELLGAYLQRRPAATRAELQIHTKLVPDRDDLAVVDRAYVDRIIERSLLRLGVERLDLVQFAWWDYEVPGYVEAAGWLADLQREGKIRLLGATNFDVTHFEEIAAAAPLVAHQVQFSPLDTRPQRGMIESCARRGAWLLCYGALAGGFLSDAYIGMAAPPVEPANRSLTKYGLVIEEFGGWDLYQELLVALAAIAGKHRVSISTVALRWLLEQPRVAAAIVGTSRRNRVRQYLAAFSFSLDSDDKDLIEPILARRAGPRGDVFGLEREPGSKHAAIMRYNLNRDG